MATQIQLRRGTAAAWRDADPILSQGEQGLELDTGKRKTGDGATAWSALPYDGPAENVINGEETRVGFWMGKPLYRREIVVRSLPNGATADFALGDFGADRYRTVQGIARAEAASHNTLPLPFVSTTAESMISIYVRPVQNQLRVMTGSDRRDYEGRISLEYTKAADAVDSSKVYDVTL